MASLTGSATILKTSAGTTMTTGAIRSAAKDVIVIGISIPSATVTVSSIHDSAGNTYTNRTRTHGTGISGEVWTASAATASSTNTITVTLSGSLNGWAIAAGSYAGVGSFDAAGTAQNANTASVSVSLSATNPGEVIIGHVFTTPAVTIGSPTAGYQDIPGFLTSYVAHQSFLLNGVVGSNTFQETISTSQNLIAVLIAIGPVTTEWSAVSGKPSVTVSAVGTAAGFSTNNGADFGPDTLGTTTSGIQEAINYVVAQGGETGGVVLSAGTFVVSATINVAAPVTIAGQGRALTVIQMANSANLNALIFAGNSSLEAHSAKLGISRLTIDGNKSNQSSGTPGSGQGAGALLIGLYADGSTVHAVRIINSWDNGMYILGVTSPNATAPSNVTPGDPTFIHVSDLVTENCGNTVSPVLDYGAGFDNGSGTRVVIDGYTGSGNGTGIVITDLGGNASTTASNVFVSGSVRDGIFNGSDATLSSFTSEFSGRAGLFLDGTGHFSGSGFRLDNNWTGKSGTFPNYGGDIYVSSASRTSPDNLSDGDCLTTSYFLNGYVDETRIRFLRVSPITDADIVMTGQTGAIGSLLTLALPSVPDGPSTGVYGFYAIEVYVDPYSWSGSPSFYVQYQFTDETNGVNTWPVPLLRMSTGALTTNGVISAQDHYQGRVLIRVNHGTTITVSIAGSSFPAGLAYNVQVKILRLA